MSEAPIIVEVLLMALLAVFVLALIAVAIAMIVVLFLTVKAFWKLSKS